MKKKPIIGFSLTLLLSTSTFLGTTVSAEKLDKPDETSSSPAYEISDPSFHKLESNTVSTQRIALPSGVDIDHRTRVSNATLSYGMDKTNTVSSWGGWLSLLPGPHSPGFALTLVMTENHRDAINDIVENGRGIEIFVYKNPQYNGYNNYHEVFYTEINGNITGNAG